MVDNSALEAEIQTLLREASSLLEATTFDAPKGIVLRRKLRDCERRARVARLVQGAAALSQVAKELSVQINRT
jgi:hypothetical protein